MGHLTSPTWVADAADWSSDEDRAAIDRSLAAIASYADLSDGEVGDAMRYSLSGGGKRVRGMLVVLAYRAVGGGRDVSHLAAAVEVVHAYSLVHDDLPCMDDEAVRRGRPTVHVAFGVRAATVAGLAMVPLAVAAALEGARQLGLPAATGAAIVRELMAASGAGGMIGGQLLDLEAEGREIELAALERIHAAKTGKLIAAAARIGGMAGGVGRAGEEALRQFGAALGLAFQIADDVLDVTASSSDLGKTAGRDVALRKSTYPALLGVEQASGRAQRLVSSACDTLRRARLLTPQLERLARFAVERRT